MKRHYFLALLLVLVITTAAGCIGQSVEAPTKSPIANATPTPSKVQTSLNLSVGEVAKTTKLQVTVTSVKLTDYYTYYSEFSKGLSVTRADPGKKFIIIDAEIQNLDTDRLFTGSGEFSVMDSTNRRFEPEGFGLSGVTDIMPNEKELYPNERLKGSIIIEIPADANGLSVLYDFGNLFTEVKLASWKIFNVPIEQLAAARSANITIDRVDGRWSSYLDSGYIYSIGYLIKNTGKVPIEPTFDITMLYQTGIFYSKKGERSYETIQPGNAITGHIDVLQDITSPGPYTIIVSLKDGDDPTLLNTATASASITE